MPVTVRHQRLVIGSEPGTAPSRPRAAGPMAAPLPAIVARYGLPFLVHRIDMPLVAGTMPELVPATVKAEEGGSVGHRVRAPFEEPSPRHSEPLPMAPGLAPRMSFPELVSAGVTGHPIPRDRPGPVPDGRMPVGEAPSPGAPGGAVRLVWQAPATQPRQERREEAAPESSPPPLRDGVTVSLEAERGVPRPEVAPPPGPSLSVPAVAEQVYRLLERRLVIERERRGIF